MTLISMRPRRQNAFDFDAWWATRCRDRNRQIGPLRAVCTRPAGHAGDHVSAGPILGNVPMGNVTRWSAS